MDRIDVFRCLDVDECAENNGDCPENSICVNIMGGHTCECMSGFDMVDGVCVDVDECLVPYRQGYGSNWLLFSVQSRPRPGLCPLPPPRTAAQPASSASTPPAASNASTAHPANTSTQPTSPATTSTNAKLTTAAATLNVRTRSGLMFVCVMKGSSWMRIGIIV